MKNAKIMSKQRAKKQSIETNDIGTLSVEVNDLVGENGVTQTQDMNDTRFINITEEALRIGKIPTEEIAYNIAKGLVEANGRIRG